MLTVVILIAHNILVESAISHAAGVSFFYASILRIGIAFLGGFILYRIYFHFGFLQEKFSLVLEQRVVPTDYYSWMSGQIQNLNNFEIYGSDYETKDGTCVRDYVHVSDVARVHIDAANYLLSEKRSHVLNLGTGTGYSVLEVIDAIEKHTNQKVFKQYHQRRAGDPPKLVSNIDLAKKILNYDPKHDISSIVKTAYNWEKNGRKDS